MATTVEKLVLLIEEVGVDEASKSFSVAKKRIEETGKAAEKTTEQVKRTSNAFKQFRGASSALTNTTGQLSVQIQDVAVQLESGTDAVRVFAQQGPQIAAIFGPKGAAFGAILAVGALVAGPFVRSFFAANEAIEEASKKLQEFKGNLTDLSEAEKRLKLIQIRNSLEEARERFSALKEEQEDLKQRQDNLIRSNGNFLRGAYEIGSFLVPFAEGFASLADAIESNEEALAKTAVALEDEGEKITELVKQKKVLQGLNEEETKERKKQAENLKDLNDQLDKQIAMLGMSVVEQKVYNALLNGANAEEAEQVRIKAKIVEAYNETTKSLEKLTDEGDKFLESLKSQAEGVGKTRSETLRLQLETLRLSDENHELAESYIAVLKQEEDRIQKLKDQKKATQELIEKGREFRALVDEEQKAIEDRQKAREEANKKRLKAENEALDDIGRAIAEEDAYYQDKAIRQADREQSNIDRRSKERADELEKDRKAAEERERIASDYTDGILMLEDRLMKGKSEKQKLGFRTLVNLSNMERRENAKKIISDSYAAAMGAQKALSGIPIVGPILGAVAAGTIIAGGVTYAANAISGGRALGGQVRDGESYIVGERGPEVLTMGSNGRIIPNDKIGTASGQQVNKVANVTFNINATDASGFDRLLQSRRGQIVSIINQAMNDRGRAAIV